MEQAHEMEPHVVAEELSETRGMLVELDVGVVK